QDSCNKARGCRRQFGWTVTRMVVAPGSAASTSSGAFGVDVTVAPVTVTWYPVGNSITGTESCVSAPAAKCPKPVACVVEQTSRKTPPENDQDVGVPATTCGYGVASAFSLAVSTFAPVGGWLGSRTSACPFGDELVMSLPLYAHSSHPVRYLSARPTISV